jgi:DNA-binding Lrp family transcriptional regulator
MQKKIAYAGTVHVRVKKMEDAGIIMGSSLVLDTIRVFFLLLILVFF